MIAGNYNINDHTRGDTFNGLQFTLKNEDNTPIDLTAIDKIESQFRAKKETGAVVKEISVGSGITITNASSGIIQIDSFLVDWNVDIYYYDIQFTFLSGVVKTYIKGTFKIVRDITIIA